MANQKFRLVNRAASFFETHNGRFFSTASLAEIKQIFLDNAQLYAQESDAQVFRLGEELTATFWVAEFGFRLPFCTEPIVAVGLSRNNNVLVLTVQENNRKPYWTSFPTQDATTGEAILDLLKQHTANLKAYNQV